jgi:hypothetical protein
MIRRFAYWTIVFALVGLSSLIVFSRHQIFGVPFAPETYRGNWEIELRLRSEKSNGSARLQLALPQPFSQFEFREESFQFAGFSVGVFEQQGLRFANLTRANRDVGVEEFFYRFLVSGRSALTLPPKSFLVPTLPELSELDRVMVLRLREIFGEPGIEMVRFIYNQHTPPENAGTEAAGTPNRELRSWAKKLSDNEKLAVLRALDMPAVYRYGLVLGRAERGAHLKKALMFHERTTGERGVIHVYLLSSAELLPEGSFIPWGGSSDPIGNIRGLENTDMLISTIPRGFASGDSQISDAIQTESNLMLRFLEFFNFERLSVHSQTIYRVLLLLPLAALVITFLRNVIGLQTFGTFMPALLALGFRETGLLTGISMAMGVIVVGVFCRFLLQRLQLLMVPRLTAVLTLVVLVFFFVSLGSASRDFYAGQSIALFPVIVLSMMVERLSVVLEELGLKKGIIQTLSTLIATVVAFVVVTRDSIMYLFSSFPELLLLVLAASLLLGRYTGFRVSEWYRFRKLRKVL